MPPSSDSAADAALPADASNVLHPDAHGADASPAPIDASRAPSADAASPDAGKTGGAGSDGDGGSSGTDASGSNGSGGGVAGSVISCFTEGNPSASCTLPTHCCFTNYSSQHNGACTTSACTWATMSCDGPEDCAGGQHCCAHAIVTPDSGVVGYELTCQASACGLAPANQEMCHPTTAAAGTCSSPSSRCVTAFGNDNDLPPSLHICQ